MGIFMEDKARGKEDSLATWLITQRSIPSKGTAKTGRYLVYSVIFLKPKNIDHEKDPISGTNSSISHWL